MPQDQVPPRDEDWPKDGAGRRVETPWRGQPRWVRVSLAVVVALFALVTSWNIARQDYALFYAATARSMAMSWRAFWFGTFDPSAGVTMDKLAGFLVPQALAVRLFGFHPWSLALPQVVEGIVTVLACYVVGTRWRGARAGLLAAVAAAATPLLASMFGHPMEDGLLTMALACAFVCWQAAARSGRLSPLLLAGVLVGVGFQAKMAQAWLVLPALVVGHLLLHRPRLRLRLIHIAALVAVTVVASLAWTIAIQLAPADRRPYVDGTTDNSMLTMVFGFNGLDRLLPGSVPGAIADAGSGSASAGPDLGTSSTTGLLKLVGYADVSQVGWLYPLAGAGLVAAAVDARGARRRRRTEATPPDGPGADPAHLPTLVALVVWLAVVAVVLSLAQVPHTAYLAAIAVPVAVLAGAGLAAVLDRLRAGPPRARVWASVALLVQVTWSAVTLRGYGNVPGAVVAVVIVAGAIGVLAAAATLLRPGALAPRATAAAVLVGVLLAPVGWTLLVLDPHDTGSASDAYTGPREDVAPGGAASWSRFSVPPPWQGRDPQEDPSSRALAQYLERQGATSRQAGTGPVVLTDYWGAAASLVIWSGVDAGAAGGFSGRAPSVTPEALSADIRSGRLPFALLHDHDTYRSGQHTRHLTPVVKADAAVVRSLCRAVPSRAWDQGHPIEGSTLYDCRR